MILRDALAPRAAVRLDPFAGALLPANPAILRFGDGFLCAVKGVNFDYERIWLTGDWQALDPRRPIDCAYKLVHLDANLAVLDAFDLDVRAVAACAEGQVTVEDIRLFSYRDQVMACGALLAREQRWTGRRWIVGAPRTRVFLAELVLDRLERPRVFDSPVDAIEEKNWAPLVRGGRLEMVTNIETGARLPVQDGGAAAPVAHDSAQAQALAWRGGWSGSSALVPHDDGYLAVAHRSSRTRPRCYRHVLLRFDPEVRPVRRSAPFSFEGAPVEFCCGLDVAEDAVTLSYGVMDKQAAVATFARKDIEDLLTLPAHDLAGLEVLADMDAATLHRRAAQLQQERDALLQELFDRSDPNAEEAG